MNLTKLMCAALASAALVLVATGCGDDDDASATPSGSAQASRTPGETQPVQFPPGYPDDFPYYPGAEVETGVRYENQVLLGMYSPDSREDVEVFFREALEQEPFSLTSDRESGTQDVRSMTFRRDDDAYQGSLTFSTGSAEIGTIINISISLPVSDDTSGPGSTAEPTESASETGE